MSLHDWIPFDQIRRYAIPIHIVLVLAVLALRFARPFIRGMLARILKSRALSLSHP